MSALDDINKYTRADEAVVASLEKTYALALSNADARLVSFSDPAELQTVRESFVKGKLGVSDPYADIDAAIAAIGERVPGRRQRLTVYYLLAEHYGKLGVFA